LRESNNPFAFVRFGEINFRAFKKEYFSRKPYNKGTGNENILCALIFLTGMVFGQDRVSVIKKKPRVAVSPFEIGAVSDRQMFDQAESKICGNGDAATGEYVRWPETVYCRRKIRY